MFQAIYSTDTDSAAVSVSARSLFIALSAALGVVVAVVMIAGIGYIAGAAGLHQNLCMSLRVVIDLIYGALAGFIASIVMPPRRRRG
jgi:Na+/melibiose symporter-like transporter